jgi:hypothetical protein
MGQSDHILHTISPYVSTMDMCDDGRRGVELNLNFTFYAYDKDELDVQIARRFFALAKALRNSKIDWDNYDV